MGRSIAHSGLAAIGGSGKRRSPRVPLRSTLGFPPVTPDGVRVESTEQKGAFSLQGRPGHTQRNTSLADGGRAGRLGRGLPGKLSRVETT